MARKIITSAITIRFKIDDTNISTPAHQTASEHRFGL